MLTFFSFLFVFSALMIAYLYGGYALVLRALLAVRGKDPSWQELPEGERPFVTVLLCVHNEEAHIKARLDNLMAQTYPADKMEVLVVSDGSTDTTNEIARFYRGAFPVRLITAERAGKSGAQNLAIKEAKGKIVVLTDCEAVFDPAFVQEIVAPYRDELVGCTTGNLGLMERTGAIAANQGLYWRYEQMLRSLENDLGILAIASGQSMSFRRTLFDDIPSHVGDDCFIPLLASRKGYKTAYCEAAKAFDVFEHEPNKEYSTRVRMTLRNWVCTWMFPDLLNPLRHAGLAFALWSHKLLRWMGGVFLGLLALSSLFLLYGESDLLALASMGVLSFFIVGAYAYQLSRKDKTPEGILGAIFSFLLVNVAFTEGLYRALTGEKIVAYKAGVLKVEKE